MYLFTQPMVTSSLPTSPTQVSVIPPHLPPLTASSFSPPPVISLPSPTSPTPSLIIQQQSPPPVSSPLIPPPVIHQPTPYPVIHPPTPSLIIQQQSPPLVSSQLIPPPVIHPPTPSLIIQQHSPPPVIHPPTLSPVIPSTTPPPVIPPTTPPTVIPPPSPCISLAPSVLSFNQSIGSTVNFSPNATPVDFFEALMTSDVIDHIVTETNRFAAQRSSPLLGWESCTSDRLKSFLGLLIIMGIKRLPNLEDYWSTESYLGCPELVSSWPYRQFRALLSSLHFNDNSTAVPRGQPGYDRLHKVRPVLEMVKNNCIVSYKPEREISIDEAMVGFKGRSALKQYLPLKPTKRGYKVWCACEANSGYLLNFSVYTGKTDDNLRTYGLGEKVVLFLSEPYQYKGYALFVDSFFSSVKLCQELLLRNTYLCSTTRSNRRQYPNELAKTTLNARGEFKSVVVDGNVSATIWKDKKCVHFLNTYYNFDVILSVKRKQLDGSVNDISCPACVKGYNMNMGGVDLCDQKRKTLSCSRKSLKWYMRLFWFILDVCVVNAHILEQKSQHHPKRTQKAFRLELGSSWLMHENGLVGLVSYLLPFVSLSVILLRKSKDVVGVLFVQTRRKLKNVLFSNVLLVMLLFALVNVLNYFILNISVGNDCFYVVIS